VSPTVRNLALRALSAAIPALAATTVFASSSQAATQGAPQPAAQPAVSCALYASPLGSDAGDGSLASPFLTPQKLTDSLQAGQTGCLRGGVYSEVELKFHHGGQANAPLTLASYPGETATLEGGDVYVPSGSDNVTIEDLHINADTTPQVGVQLMASGSSLIGDDITNGSAHNSCIIVGSNLGWGQAVNTVIQDDVIHQCGSPADGNQDHGIYVDNSINATIDNNVIWGAAAFAVHLYQSSQGSQVTHNVIVNNGYGVIFAGSDTHTSSNNLVADNIIANSQSGYDVESWWGGAVGSGNVLQGNCISSTSSSQGIEAAAPGFTAAGNVTATPDFVNAAAHDYRLQSHSPCLPTVGYDTQARISADPVAAAPVATVSSTHPVAHPARTRVAHPTHARATHRKQPSSSKGHDTRKAAGRRVQR
jgi:hypothetical protein